ncbi:MAG: efflux RND transporter permease subunit [Verrucomicrobia bacterium]|nr:efflux RND transporter permease subunit [Verrucomicrobiota bacterium]
MSLSEPFIRRPIATTLLTIGLFLAGLIAFPLLPVAPLPQVEFPTLQVSAALPGASPETMASSVATPLENQLAQIAGVTQMSSSSTLGSTNITIQFDLGVQLNAAAQEVQAAINAAAGQLPPELPSPPTYRKVNPADAPVVIMRVTSEVLPITAVTDFANNVVAQQISQLPGIAQVLVNGQQKPAVRVQVDPTKLAALGLGMEEVRTALAGATVNTPKGNLEGARQSLAIYANDQLTAAAPYNDVVIAYRNGAPIRVRDIGTALDGAENARAAAWVDGQRGLGLIVFKQADANVIETVGRIRALLPALQAAVPPAVHVEIMMDRTRTIRASVAEVQLHLVLTMVLVTLVVFLFLRDLRATLISSVVVPVSIVATFGVMYLLGFSLNNLSLMALTIAVGFVIDDAIVMLENIYRHIEEGMPARDAAFKGAAEIGFTILSITVSLVAVFIPVLLMGGIIGRLFREFAVTVTVAVLVSAFVSLTCVPMLGSLFLRAHAAARAGSWKARLDAVLEGSLAWMEATYRRGLQLILRHQTLTLLSLVVTFALTALLFVRMPKGFFPQQDTGFLTLSIEGPPDISFQALSARVERINAILQADPAVEHFMTSIGTGRGGGSQNVARGFMSLKPREEREPAPVVMARLRQKGSSIPGLTLYPQARQDLNIGGIASKTQYQYTLRDVSSEVLNAWAPRLLAKLQELPQLRDVTSDQESAALAVSVVIDRSAASRFGIQADAINRALYNAFGQRQITQFYTDVSQYKVIIEVPPELQADPATFDKLFLSSPVTGRQVPLSSLIRLDPRATRPLSINHLGQYPSVTISFNLAPDFSLGQAVELIRQTSEALGLPASTTGSFQGTAQAFEDSLRSQPLLILAAVVAIYLILGMLYESFIHPLTILSTLPSAGLGALLTLLAFGYDLSVIGIIGILLLIGIVKKNAIMVIDFALEAQRERGQGAAEAVEEACLKRFRPIMMTTLAAMIGGIPLALGHGDGSELRQPLGFAIVGGLVLSQALTLFTTPVVFLWFDRLATRWRKVAHQPAPAGEAVAVR